METWVSKQPASAGHYLLQNSGDPPGVIVERVVSKWAYGDPFGAAGWISELSRKVESPKDLDDGLVVVAVALAHSGNAGVAVDRVEKITRVDLRQHALKNVIFEISRTDRASARALLNHAAVAPETREEILEIYLGRDE